MARVMLRKKMSAGIIRFGIKNGARTVLFRKCATQKVRKV
jgi:hypothetical protein